MLVYLAVSDHIRALISCGLLWYWEGSRRELTIILDTSARAGRLAPDRPSGDQFPIRDRPSRVVVIPIIKSLVSVLPLLCALFPGEADSPDLFENASLTVDIDLEAMLLGQRSLDLSQRISLGRRGDDPSVRQ